MTILSKAHSGINKVLLQPGRLPLQDGDVSDAAIDGVTDPCRRLVEKSADSVVPELQRDVSKHLGDVAGAENLVHGGEVVEVVRGEVGLEDAGRDATSLQVLAGSAGRRGMPGGIHLLGRHCGYKDDLL